MTTFRISTRLLRDTPTRGLHGNHVKQLQSCAPRFGCISIESGRLFSSSSKIQQSAGPWSDPIKKQLNRYVILAEDFADAGALARRLEVRDRHLEQAARGKEVGRIELGGGLLKRDFNDIDPEEGPASSLAGSLFVVKGESIEEVRARLNQDEYVRAAVFDPSKIRIFPFLRSMNEQSVAVGNEAIGETQPVSLRRPRGESSVRSSLNKRNEVYVKDPRGSGKSLNSGDRRSAENTLGHLRNSQPRSHKSYTLDNLRKNPLMPSEEGR